MPRTAVLPLLAVSLWTTPVVAQKARATLQHEGPVTNISFSHDGACLAAVSKGKAFLWQARDVERKKASIEHPFVGDFFTLAFSPDRLVLAASAYDADIGLYHVKDDKWQRLKGHRHVIFSLAFSPDGATLASACKYGYLKLWDPRAGKWLKDVDRSFSGWHTLAFNPAGTLLACDTPKMGYTVWDIATRTVKARLATEDIATVLFADHFTLACAGFDGSVKLWDVAKEGYTAALGKHERGVRALTVTRDRKTLASAGDDGSIHIWDVPTRKERFMFSAHEECIRTLAFSPDGRTLASGSDDRTIKLWEIPDRER